MRLALAVLLALGALLAPGAVLASGELGASIGAAVYADESRTLPILNRSNVEVRASLEAEDGWTVEPASMILQPGEQAAATVNGSGDDGALLTVRMVATETPPPGEQASELALVARVYHERPEEPVNLLSALLGAFLVGMVGYAAWRAYRRLRPQP